MNPVVHAELSWLLAARMQRKRDRLLVTLAGLAPDLDGLTIIAGEDAYGRWHHVLTHGVVAAVGISVVCGVVARRWQTAALAFVAVHLHLLCDLAGSGPGWPISYVVPFSRAELMWQGQWDLASWQNSLIGLAATVACLGCAVWVGRTPVELLSMRGEAAVVKTLMQRFGRRA